MSENEQVKTQERAVIPLRLSRAGERREYGVTFIKAGLVRRRDGSFANWRIPPETLQAAVDKLDGVAVFVDHADWFEYPSMRNLAAVTFGPVWNAENQSIDGGIRLYKSADWLRQLLDEILADQEAGLETPDIGLSLVFYGVHEWEGDGDEAVRVTREIKHVESCDIVFGPAAEGRIKEILSKMSVERSGERPPDVQADNENPVDDRERLLIRGERSREQIFLAQNGGKEVSEQKVVYQVGEVQAQEPPAGGAAPESEQVDRLAEIEAKLERLTAILAEKEAVQAVQGMGVAPVQVQVATPLEQFSGVVDWLFGVPGAETPDPDFRRADAIYRALTGDYEFRGVFDPDRVMLAGATTTTLPNLALNAMNKVIRAQFSAMSFWRWFERVVAVTPNDGSLHDMQWITYGGIDNLPTVAEGGAYTELTVGDAKESSSFVKKGGYVGITREMLKNSDIMRIQAVPRALAIAAVRTRSAAVSDIFTSNAGVGPTLAQDSTALFDATHNNLATDAFSETAWRTARAECFKHAEVTSGKALGVFPRFCLVPADLYDTALSVFGYGEGYPQSYKPEATDRGNEDPRPVPLVVPDWTDSNDWAYIVDPQVYPVIQMSYSQNPGGNSHPLPELYAVTSETSGLMFTNDVLPIKVRDEFAVGVNGPRGIGKRNVV